MIAGLTLPYFGGFMTRRVQISMLLTVAFILLACGPSLKSVKWTERREAVHRLGPEDQAIQVIQNAAFQTGYWPVYDSSGTVSRSAMA